MSTRIAVCQVPDIINDADASLDCIKEFTARAEKAGAHLVCFPECFLQGYITENPAASQVAISLSSDKFVAIRKELKNYSPLVVFGLIEQDNESLYNTVVLIKDGELIGIYRKIFLLDGESIFSHGNDHPVFTIRDITFGINICYDTQFPEASSAVAGRGASLLLCPCNTMMSTMKAEKFKYLHLPMRAERAKENKLWILSSDVTGEQPGRIAYGTTSVIDPGGKIVEQVPYLEKGLLVVEFDQNLMRIPLEG